MFAKTRSSFSVAVVSLPPDSFHSAKFPSSRPCIKTPFNTDLYCSLFSGCIFNCRMMRFFFVFKISSASILKAGAINTSKNISLIALAVSLSISALHINTPPKALSGSPARAAFQLSFTVSLIAIPQTFVCLMIANIFSLSSNSFTRFIAASTSTRLL